MDKQSVRSVLIKDFPLKLQNKNCKRDSLTDINAAIGIIFYTG